MNVSVTGLLLILYVHSASSFLNGYLTLTVHSVLTLWDIRSSYIDETVLRPLVHDRGYILSLAGWVDFNAELRDELDLGTETVSSAVCPVVDINMQTQCIDFSVFNLTPPTMEEITTENTLIEEVHTFTIKSNSLAAETPEIPATYTVFKSPNPNILFDYHMMMVAMHIAFGIFASVFCIRIKVVEKKKLCEANTKIESLTAVLEEERGAHKMHMAEQKVRIQEFEELCKTAEADTLAKHKEQVNVYLGKIAALTSEFDQQMTRAAKRNSANSFFLLMALDSTLKKLHRAEAEQRATQQLILEREAKVLVLIKSLLAWTNKWKSLNMDIAKKITELPFLITLLPETTEIQEKEDKGNGGTQSAKESKERAVMERDVEYASSGSARS